MEDLSPQRERDRILGVLPLSQKLPPEIMLCCRVPSRRRATAARGSIDRATMESTTIENRAPRLFPPTPQEPSPLHRPGDERLPQTRLSTVGDERPELLRQDAGEGLHQYRSIFAASKEAIAIIGPDGKYREQNEAHRELTGYSDEELRGRTPAIHLGPAVFESIANGLAREGRFCGEVVSRTKAGGLVELEVSAFSVKDEKTGGVLCYVGIKRDISARKASEQALARRAAEQAVLYQFTDRMHRSTSLAEIYDSALEAIASGLGCERASILLADAAGTMRFVRWRGLSEGYRKAVEGHSPWSPDQQNPQPVCVPDIDESDVPEALRTVIKSEGIGALAFMPMAANGCLMGKFTAYYAQPHAFTKEELDLGLTIARQLCFAIVHKRAEEGNARLAAIVEHSDDAIVGKDLHGIIKSWNRGAERIFGYTADEAVGQSITLLIPADRQHEESEILARIRRGETVSHYHTIRRRKDGTLFDISLTVSPIRNGRGEVIGASKIARDITDQRRASEKLEQAVQERTASLQEAIAQMEEFSYTVSHDLRAPLRGMQTYSKALLEDFSQQLGPEGTHYVHRLLENANRLDKMILDVLTFSRFGRAELKMERVCLSKLVGALVDQLLQGSSAEIQLKPLEDVLGHEPSLTQAISNLLSNAVKFARPGVRPRVKIWTQRQNGEVRLWIEDNGIGIEPRYQHRLFNLFERIHPKLKYEGTGVGLAIVRKAAERMGGQVGVDSDGVNGSRFWIQLPAAE